MADPGPAPLIEPGRNGFYINIDDWKATSRRV